MRVSKLREIEAYMAMLTAIRVARSPVRGYRFRGQIANDGLGGQRSPPHPRATPASTTESQALNFFFRLDGDLTLREEWSCAR